MKITNINFITSAVSFEQYPKEGLAEIAFVGRSNVGKSSLLNTLTGQKKIAKVSSTPGKTQLINFFRINKALIFVDLPGYGYAKVPIGIKSRWKNMIESYLIKREQLNFVFQLIDSRHNPSKEDLLMHKWLQSYFIRTVIVCTKIDKIPKTKRIKQEIEIRKSLFIDNNTPLILFSAKNGEGKKEIWKILDSLIKVKK